MTPQWYALHCKPMKEALLWEQLSLHEIEGYYPRIRVQPANPRARKIKPYFPGYVFGRVDLEQTNMTTLWWMPGSAGIVSFDGMPSHVPEVMIAAIRRRVDEINAAGGELFDGLKTGDVLTVQEGPFKGYEAIFDARLSGDDRVRVLLKLLTRGQVRLELPGRQIRRKKQ
jgi:transcription antitermination factor NusG